MEQDRSTPAEETGVAAEATFEGNNSSEATMTPEHKVDTESGVGVTTTGEEGGHSVEATKDIEGNNSFEATVTPEYGRHYSCLN